MFSLVRPGHGSSSGVGEGVSPYMEHMGESREGSVP